MVNDNFFKQFVLPVKCRNYSNILSEWPSRSKLWSAEVAGCWNNKNSPFTRLTSRSWNRDWKLQCRTVRLSNLLRPCPFTTERARPHLSECALLGDRKRRARGRQVDITRPAWPALFAGRVSTLAISVVFLSGCETPKPPVLYTVGQ